MDEGYGKERSIPQLIMAGASVDDVYVIVLFSVFMGMYSGNGFNLSNLLKVPVAILTGLIIGFISGQILVWLFKKIHIRDTIKVILILSVSLLIVTLETVVKPYIPISGLLGVMAVGGTILKQYELLANRIMGKFSKIWVGAEILLFVLVGAVLDIRYIPKAGISAVILIIVALLFRLIGVNFSLLKTHLNLKERLFCSIAYTPKATVQAAIGSLPLTAGVLAGNTILTVAVLAIMITAPFGAIGIDHLHDKLLEKDM